MSRTIKSLKQFLRKIACRRQKQEDLPAAPSASITPGDASATGTRHDQQEQSKNSTRPTSPVTTSPINTQQPTTAQSLWDQAYDALAKKMPSLVKDYDELLEKEQMANSAPNETTPPQLPAPHNPDTHSDGSRRHVQLNAVIQKGLQQMENNKTAYSIAGHEFVLEDQITQVSKVLLWGKDWIGSAIKVSPEASLVWSGVCLILPLLTNPTTAAEANRNGFAYVTTRMRYYVALEPMLRQLGLNASVDKALINAANSHTVELYQVILEFQLSSVLRFYQSRLKTYAHDTVTSEDWKQNLLDIKTLEESVNNNIAQINDLATREELERLNRTSEATYASMESFLSVATEQLTVSKKQLAVHEEAKQERLLAEERKCLQAFWLTQSANGAGYDWYKDRVESRIEGTCGWFLNHENFQKWLSQESGPLLVSADPGCGKSVLAKYLIDHGLAQQSATICYFFFKDQDQNTIRQALCALLHQLFFQKSALIKHAMKLYNKLDTTLVDSDTRLWTLLRDAVCDPQAGPVIFVIDALDECAESELSSLITNLEDILCDRHLANSKFRVLMTSRPYLHVVNEFNGLRDEFRHIHIPGEEEFEAIGQEINSVVQHRVKQLAKKHRLSDNVESFLNSKLLAIDHRTYLWVYLVFDYLDQRFNKGFAKTEDGIHAAIQTLPKSVNHAYDQILNRSQDDETVNTVKKALSIILAAHRPLTISEMNFAMKLDDQGRGRSINDLELEQDEDFKTRFRALCGLFVNVHHDKIYFLHQTAREFLLQSSAPATIPSDLQWYHSITTRHAHSILAEVCMLYLDRLNSTDTETFRTDDHHGALLDYSVMYWGDHCHEAEFQKGSAMVELASELCAPDSTSHSQWASIVCLRYYLYLKSSTNVLIASHHGLPHVTELLLSRGADIEAEDMLGRTALMLAIESGHEAVTRLLLEKGADVDAKKTDGMTALMLAAESGHEAVTRLLLEKGADVDAKRNGGMTALMLAAKSGHEAVTRLLLEKGADVEARVGDGWNSMIHSATSESEAITQLLNENGADIEAMVGDGWAAIMNYAKFGHELFTQLLHEKSDDAKARFGDGWTALIHAAKHGNEAVTRLLLQKGADVEAKGKDGRTALILAIDSGHEAVTRLLLENRADVEARDANGWTMLMLAADSGHEAVARLLLNEGADVKARDGDGQTALMHAAESGYEAVTRLLLENGADVEAKDGIGRTALMLAAKYGHEAVIRLLLEKGANVEARDSGDGHTALVYAAASGREVITRLLLDKGADVEARDVDGWTTLMQAAHSGHEAVARLLLDEGVDVKASDGDGQTALMHAAKSGYEAVSRLLLEKGADVEARDGDGQTALMFAAKSGHEVAARLLLDKGADVKTRDGDGQTALMFAAKSAKSDDGRSASTVSVEPDYEVVIRLLLDNGADVEAKDNKGWTALRHAAETTTRLLPDHGTQVEAKDVEG